MKKKILIILTFLFIIGLFYEIFFLKKVFFGSDIMRTSLPIRKVITHDFNNNIFPYWNKYILNGFPHYASAQSGLFNPVNLILYSVFSVEYALTLSQICNYILSFLFMIILLRYFKFEFYIALISGLIFAFSGFAVSHFRNIAFISSYPYLPLIFLLVNKWLNKKNIKYLIYLTLIFAVQLSSGHPQLPFYSIVLVLIYLLYFNIVKFKKLKLKTLIYLCIFILFSFGLTAFILFPMYNLSEFVKPDNINKLSYITSFSMPWYFYFQFIIPFFMGHPGFNCYYGSGNFYEFDVFIPITIIILLIINLKKMIYDKETKFYNRFFLLIILFSVFMSIGNINPLYRILQYIPGFNFFRVPARYNYLLIFAVSFLSAVSIKKISDNIEINKKTHYIIVAVSIILFISSLLIFIFKTQIIDLFDYIINLDFDIISNRGIKRYGIKSYENKLIRLIDFQKFNLLIISVIYFINFLLYKNIKKLRFQKFLVLLIILELFISSKLIFNSVNIGFFRNPPKTVKYLKQKNPDNDFKIFSWNRGRMYIKFKDYKGYLFSQKPDFYLRNFLYDNYASIFDIKSFHGDNSLVYTKFIDINNNIKKGNIDLLKIFGVDYLITGIPLNNGNYEYKKIDDVFIYNLKNSLPEFYLTDNIKTFNTEKTLLNFLNNNTQTIIKNQYALINTYDNFEFNKNTKLNYKIEKITDLSTKLKFKVNINKPGFFILNQSYYPEWKVKVNGIERKLYNVNYMVKGVFLENSGKHIIEFYYDASAFKIGVIISVFTFLILCFLYYYKQYHS